MFARHFRFLLNNLYGIRLSSSSTVLLSKAIEANTPEMYKYSRKTFIYSHKLYLCVNIILTHFEFSTLLSNFVEQTYKSQKADKTAPFSQSYRHSQQSYQQAIAENNNSQRKTPGISRCTFIRSARAEIGFPTFFSQKSYFYAFVKETSRSMRKSVFFHAAYTVCQYLRSRLRSWIACATCLSPMVSHASISAMVLARRRMRS